MENIAVELRHVSKLFSGPHNEPVVAVDQVQLEVQDGEFFSFLGPSGCGKTTSLRMIAGFELPSDGEIFIQGKPVGHMPPYKRPVNTVFQSYALWPHMNVFQNVSFGLEMARVPKPEIGRRVAETLELVQLTGMDKRRPRQLSGGQQQRVALARALVQHPAVLLLDEPLGALDLKLRKAMQLELKQMQRQVGITFVYVTHDQEEALTMSDRIAVMNAGRVLQIGEPTEIYEQPVNRFVADFIGETNFLEASVVAYDGTWAEVLIDDQLRVKAVAGEPLAVGQPVTVALRPEKLLVAAPAEQPEALPGRVEEAVYIGTDMRYLIRLTKNSRVVVRMQNIGAGPVVRFEPGDDVRIAWDTYSARVLTQ
jgi:spermidine/putrescine transport system ATP-binding protein